MTLTNERLKALLDELKSWQYGYDPVDDKEQFDMLATAEWAVIELLANREAQPVAWSTVFGDKRAVTVHADTAEVWNSDGLQVQSLYTAPPAPAVPECFLNAVAALESLYRNGQKHNWNERYTADMAYSSGVLNACRAAMLAAAPEYDILEDYRAEMLKRVTFGGDGKSSCNANSPEIPEGWKPVPVEPTKEMINAALAAGCASIRSAYREMLAAAPESGNEN
ncbi:TPA: hypothetical protein KEU09_003026 [Serratia marcescens]|nr:hypothetical protein [Serratia marcescens]